jgi:broad specificity phosphatase PhoE
MRSLTLPDQLRRTMDTAAERLELVQRVLAVRDTAILDRLREVMDTEVSDDDISEEEVAELEMLRAERLRGEGTSHSWEDVQRMAREAIKG